MGCSMRRPTSRGRAGSSSSSGPNIEMPPGNPHLRGPADPHDPPAPAVPGLHPRRVAELEPKIREFCARSLDPLVGARPVRLHRRPRRPDAHADDRPAARHPRGRTRRPSVTTPTPTCAPRTGEPMEVKENFVTGEHVRRLHRLAGRSSLRRHHDRAPQRGVRGRDGTTQRHLTRAELLTYIDVVAGAGNETTTRLIGWTGKVLGGPPGSAVGARRRIPPSFPPPSRRCSASSHLRRTWPATWSGTRSRCTARACPPAASCSSSWVRRTGTTGAYPDGDEFDIHRTPIGTSRSATASTCAWARRWPGWRVASRWRRC